MMQCEHIHGDGARCLSSLLEEEIDVEVGMNHVGTGVLARTGGAPAPRSLAATTNPFSLHPPTPDADIERYIDQHPLMKLKPPTLEEIIGSV